MDEYVLWCFSVLSIASIEAEWKYTVNACCFSSPYGLALHWSWQKVSKGRRVSVSIRPSPGNFFLDLSVISSGGWVIDPWLLQCFVSSCSIFPSLSRCFLYDSLVLSLHPPGVVPWLFPLSEFCTFFFFFFTVWGARARCTAATCCLSTRRRPRFTIYYLHTKDGFTEINYLIHFTSYVLFFNGWCDMVLSWSVVRVEEACFLALSVSVCVLVCSCSCVHSKIEMTIYLL